MVRLGAEWGNQVRKPDERWWTVDRAASLTLQQNWFIAAEALRQILIMMVFIINDGMSNNYAVMELFITG